jgi:metal-dependent amidase/aminoacylase/carboxypeptidase family protein
VLTCGTINGGYGYNIIADKVKIGGTCRSYTPAVRQLIIDRMNDVCCGVARMRGGEITMDYRCKRLNSYFFFHFLSETNVICLVDGYDATVNAYPECTQSVVDAATPFVGKERASKPQKTMAAEDFSYFLQERPGFEEKNKLFI